MRRTDSANELLSRTVAAIRALQIEIRWKPGKDIQHLRTRQHYGHLPIAATLIDYEDIITSILRDDSAYVYVYVWQSEVTYPTIVGNHKNRRWLVMFDLEGVMETAFPPTVSEVYLSDPRFQYLGTMKELLA